MKFLDVFLAKMVDSTGRTSRNDFWMTILWIFLFNVAFALVVSIIGLVVKLPWLLSVVGTTISIVILLSTVSMQIRRLHDTNKSAWYLLINLIPGIGQIIVIVFYLMPGDQGSNTYGEPTSIQ